MKIEYPLTIMRFDKEMCNDLVCEWVQAHTGDLNKSNDSDSFRLAGTKHFHSLYTKAKITNAELGLIIDQIMSW